MFVDISSTTVPPPVVCLVFCMLHTVGSYPTFRNLIPNGDTVHHPCDPSVKWTGVGHEAVKGGGTRNQFGLDFLANGKKWSEKLCKMDSDGDGLTNGEELGDPDCTWETGDTPSVTPAPSHPGVCEPLDNSECIEKNTFLDCKTSGFQCPSITQPGVFQVRAGLTSDIQVPAKKTTYLCQGVNLPTSGDYHLIAATPDIDNVNVAHHILVYGCKETVRLKASQISRPFNCYMGDVEGCKDIIAMWSVGNDGICYHDDVGFSVGSNGYSQAVFEIRWSNPDLKKDHVDSSGINLYLTPNKRPNDAGVFMIGQNLLLIPPKEDRVQAVGGCSSDCTPQLMNGPVKVVGTLNHMRGLGVRGLAEIIKPGGKRYDMARDETYDSNSPMLYKYKTPLEVNPGDALSMTCEYNSMTRSKTTFMGEEIKDEVCYAFIIYYPKYNFKSHECISHGVFDSCDLEQGNVTHDGCEAAYRDPESTEMQALAVKVFEHCIPGICLKECIPVTRELRQNPCFKGDMRTLNVIGIPDIKDQYYRLIIEDFWYRSDSCLTELAKENWDCEHSKSVSRASSLPMVSSLCLLALQCICLALFI